MNTVGMSKLDQMLPRNRQQFSADTSSVAYTGDPINDIRDNDEWWAAIKARRAANKHASYARHRPARYETASYGLLTPEQDPAGKVSRWLDSGPRALILAGPPRTGKTTAAYAIGNAADTAGIWVVGRSAPDLSAALKPDGEDNAYQRVIDCDLLLIDDLGRERVTEWWLEQLHRILDDRCGNQKRLIVTANTSPDAARAFDELTGRYGDPIVERMIDGGGVIIMDGPPVRKVVTDW